MKCWGWMRLSCALPGDPLRVFPTAPLGGSKANYCQELIKPEKAQNRIGERWKGLVTDLIVLAGHILAFKFSLTPSTFLRFPGLQQILQGLLWDPGKNLPFRPRWALSALCSSFCHAAAFLARNPSSSILCRAPEPGFFKNRWSEPPLFRAFSASPRHWAGGPQPWAKMRIFPLQSPKMLVPGAKADPPSQQHHFPSS